MKAKEEENLIDLLNDLYLSGRLKLLIDSGVLAPSVYKKRNVYNTYLIFYKKSGSKMQAMNDISLNFKISLNSVRKIRKMFEQGFN